MNDNELDRLYGGNKNLQATLEPSCNITRSDSAAEAAGRIGGGKQSLLRNVVQRAKSLGTWIEIDTFLEEHGYTVDMDDIWFDGKYEISDVKSTNVLVDQNGFLRFIDAVVNEVSFKIDRVNKISIKHPGKRTT